jgi:hypothetical protein
MGNSPQTFPNVNLQVHIQWPLTAALPNHSYGIAEDFRRKPITSLPLKYVKLIIKQLRKFVKRNFNFFQFFDQKAVLPGAGRRAAG